MVNIIYPQFPTPADTISYLTASGVIRQISYSAKQLYILVAIHGLPMPCRSFNSACYWDPSAISDWREKRDANLLSRLI